MTWLLLLQVLGASWYLLSIERQATCWKSECKNESGPVKCFPHYLECGTLDDNDQGIWENSTLVFNNCNPESTTSFINGIFENTLTNNVVSSKFLEKYFYCLWWGLQNLRYASCLLCYLILHFPFWMMTVIIVMQCFSLNKLLLYLNGSLIIVSALLFVLLAQNFDISFFPPSISVLMLSLWP